MEAGEVEEAKEVEEEVNTFTFSAASGIRDAYTSSIFLTSFVSLRFCCPSHHGALALCRLCILNIPCFLLFSEIWRSRRA
jgi:hypothetical protein